MQGVTSKNHIKMKTASQLYADLDKVKDAAMETLREQIKRFGGKVDLDALGCAFEDEAGNYITEIDLENVYFNDDEDYPLGELGLMDGIALINDLEKHTTLPNPAQQFIEKVNEREPGTFPTPDAHLDITDYSHSTGGEVIVK